MTEYKPAEALDWLLSAEERERLWDLLTERTECYPRRCDGATTCELHESLRLLRTDEATLRRALKPQAQPQEATWARCHLTMTDDTECVRATDDDDGPGCGRCLDEVLAWLRAIPATQSREALLEAKADMLEALVHQRVRERDWLATTLAHADAAFFGLIPSQGKRTPEEWIRLASSNAVLATLSTAEED